MGIFNLTGNVNPEPSDSETVVQNVEPVKEHTDVIKPNEKLGDNSHETKTIVIDGPLSSIYTKALNMIYSKEDLVNMIQDPYTDDEKVEEKDVYVYCCSSDDIEENGVVAVSDKLRLALDSKRAKKIILAVECGQLVSDKIGLLDGFSSSIGVKLISSRSTALEVIKNSLK